MSDSTARTFSSDFKRFFLRGLVVLLPSVLTLWIVVKAYQFVDSTIAEPVNGWVRLAMIELAPRWEPLGELINPSEQEVSAALAAASTSSTPVTREQMRDTLRTQRIESWWDQHWYMNLIGLLVAIIGVYIAGRLLGGFLGRNIYRKIERIIVSLPVVKQVYPYVKQIVDFLFSDDKKMRFNRVVMVQYPRAGLWSLAFQTGAALPGLDEQAPDSVTLFVPSAPTPFTGYTICVPRREVIEMPMTVEEALRYIVSGGVLVPDRGGPTLIAVPPPPQFAPAPALNEPAQAPAQPLVAALRAAPASTGN